MSTISASTTSTTAFGVTADTTGALVFQTGASPTTAVTIGTNQYIGVGTTSTTYPFQIGTNPSASSSPMLALNPATGTNGAIIYFNNSGSGGLNIGRSDSAGAGSGTTITAYDSFVATTGTTGLSFHTNNTRAMYIDSGQNVGIGTSSPSYKLDIQQTSTTTARIATTTGSGSPGAGLMFQGSLAAGKNWLIGSSYVATAGGLEFIPSTANGGTTFTTPAMILNSSGYMTIPYQPCFYATVTGSGTVAGSTVIPFNSTVVNIGSCFNTSTYRFTAPVAGTYMFIAQPSFNGASTARVSIRRNGSFYFEYEGEGTTNGWLTTTFGSLITMAVNDYVDMYNGNNSLAYDASRWMGFYGYLIG